MNQNNDWKSTDAIMWKPEKEGEVLQGFLTHKRPKTGDKSAFYKIEDSNQDLHIVFGSATLDTGMDRVEVGNEVKITFNGTKDIGKKYPLKLFEVVYRNNPNSQIEITEEKIGEPK